MEQKDREDDVWQIRLWQFRLPEEILRDGAHFMRFGFAQSKMSQQQKICFDSKAPQAVVRYTSEAPNEKRIRGQVVDENPDEKISVEVAFGQTEKLQTTPIEVSSFLDSSGRRMFAFEYRVQNIPQIPRDDPRYSQPFFGLKIKDGAGNEFHHTSTYSAFIAEGEQTFGTSAAEILFQRIDVEKIPVAIGQKKTPATKKLMRNIIPGKPLITLRVVIRTPNLVELSWNRLPENLRATPEHYIVLRQKQEIGASFDTTYADPTIAAESTYQYQVLARSRDDKYYPSNVIPVPSYKKDKTELLRQIAATLNKEQVKAMLLKKGFFDSRWYKKGQGYANKFELKTIQGEKVVKDNASGLMWQRSGSLAYMTYEKAQAWINELNRQGFAGYKDWRLPTLEEVMGLIEPAKNKAGLYIDPVFDSRQTWIWTSDSVTGAAWRWVVNFLYGYCDSSGFNLYANYVRAVRFGQSSP